MNKGELSSAGIDWRTYQKLEKRRAALVSETVNKPTEARTHKEQEVIQKVVWQSDKRRNHLHGFATADGTRLHTSNGATYYRRGVGQPRK